MHRIFLLICLLYSCSIMAASINIGAADATGSRNCVLENKYLRAEFSTLGGRLVSLKDKRSGQEFTIADANGRSGAFKDQFPPMKYDFTKVQYQARIVSDNGKTVALELQSPRMQGEFQFLKITRVLTLQEGQTRLHCDLSIANQKESMAPTVINYWQHNFFGVSGEDNNFLLPLPSGVHCAVPNAQNNARGLSFFTQPVRGWLAMLGVSGKGVVVLPEYKRFELAFSWYCKGSTPLDTLEWRMIPEEVPDGASLKSSFGLGLVNGLAVINGAGQDGCGKVRISPSGPVAELQLQGFRPAAVQVKVLLDGREVAARETSLQPERISELSIPLPALPAQSVPLLVQVWEGQKMLFDLMAKTAGEKEETVTFAPLEERQKPIEDDEEWQFELSAEYVSPHYPWQKGGENARVMFLVPTDGTRDIIELQQRFNIDPIAPTVFPHKYGMSWRVKTSMPVGVPQTGLNFLQKFLDEEQFSVLVIGNRPDFKAPLKWTDYPPLLRHKILSLVEGGVGLLYINPTGEDKELTALLKGLEPIGRAMTASMDFSAAPHFPGSSISIGQYGKGRVAVVKYRSSAFVAPHSGHRNPNWALLQTEHRFQEYQFAILGRLLNCCLGRAPLLTAAGISDGKLNVNALESGEATVDFFGRYSQPLQSLKVNLQAGSNSINCPPLPHGRVYAHIRLGDRDFAFASAEIKRPEYIATLDMNTTFEAGEPVRAKIALSPAAAGASIEQEIIDNTGRLLYRGQGTELLWKPANAVVNRHVFIVRLCRNGELLDERQQEFFLPDVLYATRNYAHLLWTDGDCFPEYTYPYRHELKRRFGFNYLYAGSSAGADAWTLKYANCEAGTNWHCNAAGLHNSNFMNSLKQWSDTHDSQYLIDPVCKNDPEIIAKLQETDVADRFHFFASRKMFQLGDEMSITYYNSPMDTCFCQFCLPDFRRWLQEHHASLEDLNRAWKTSFQAWDEVRPMPYGEAFLHPSPAPWVEHRLYMDHLFARTLQTKRQALLQKYPGALIGPTGVNSPPHVYGGNWNFWNMRVFDCASYYGTGRIPLSFGREQRLIMQYRGYNTPENATRHSFWEGLLAGERGSNNWYGPIFILPDLRTSQVRKYYQKLLWELRSGPGDLLYHSRKVTDQVAILHSQVSLIANFLKQKKAGYYDKQLSFARALEDLGLGYRFVAPEEISAGALAGFQALILPEASALSDAEVAAIREFVQKGGILLADYEPATQDQYCNARQKPALDDLFGISTRRFSLGKVSAASVPGLNISQAGKGITVTAGIALHSAKINDQEVPLVITHQFGRGRTAYLNFVPEYNASRDSGQDRGFLELLQSLLQLKPMTAVTAWNNPVQQSAFVNGQTYYFGLLPQPMLPNWQNRSREDLQKAAASAEVELFRSGHLYDIRKGEYLGHTNKCRTSLVPGDAVMLALLPYKVTGLALTAPDRVSKGEIVKIKAAVQSDATPAHHVLLLTVRRPDGAESLEYRQIESVGDGRMEFTLPFALNDLPGKWRIQVRDAASGMTAEKNIILQ